MMLAQCCESIVSSWVCHFLSFAFLVLHCFALVLVVNHATVQPELWRSVLLATDLLSSTVLAV